MPPRGIHSDVTLPSLNLELYRLILIDWGVPVQRSSTTNLFMISFLSRTIDFFFFFLSLWIYLWLAETSQQPISQTAWLKVTPHCNHCTGHDAHLWSVLFAQLCEVGRSLVMRCLYLHDCIVCECAGPRWSIAWNGYRKTDQTFALKSRLINIL